MQSVKSGKETKEKITQEAIKLFVHRGYNATTIDNIVKKVGLTKGAFYTHFESKAKLLLSIVDRYKSCSVDEVVRLVLESKGDAIATLNQVITFNSRFAEQNQDLCVFLTFLSTELKGNGEFQPALKAVYKVYTDCVAKLIQEGIDQGLLKKGLDPQLVALTFVGLHGGSLHQWIVNREAIDAEKFVRTFREIFFTGIVQEKNS
jgi:AcrR family transcriptional regulator